MKTGRKPLPRKAVKLLRDFRREGSTMRTIRHVTGLAMGTVCKYTKGVRV
jgi:hypothetical protein